MKAYIKNQGLQTDVGPHELVAVFKKYPHLFNLYGLAEGNNGLFSMGNGYEEKMDEKERLVQYGLLIDDNIIINEHNCDALRIGKVAVEDVFTVRKLLTIKKRHSFRVVR